MIVPMGLADHLGGDGRAVGEGVDADEETLGVGAYALTLQVVPNGRNHFAIGDNALQTHLLIVGRNNSLAETAHFVGGTYTVDSIIVGCTGGSCGRKLESRLGGETDDLTILEHSPERSVVAVIPSDSGGIVLHIAGSGSLLGVSAGIPVVIAGENSLAGQSISLSLGENGVVGMLIAILVIPALLAILEVDTVPAAVVELYSANRAGQPPLIFSQPIAFG